LNLGARREALRSAPAFAFDPGQHPRWPVPARRGERGTLSHDSREAEGRSGSLRL